MQTDPNAAPETADAGATPAENGRFLPEGRSVPARNGWAWIVAARALTRPCLGVWIGIFVIFAAIVIGLSLLQVLGSIVLTFIGPVLFGGIVSASDDAQQKAPVRVARLFSGFGPNLVRLFGVGVFCFVAYGAIFLILALSFGAPVAALAMGLQSVPEGVNPLALFTDPVTVIALLLMLALLVPVYMAIWFSTPLIVLERCSIGRALAGSFIACAKNVLPFLVYGVMMLLLAIAATLPLLVGWLVLGPVLLASIYTGYRDIFYNR